MTAPRLAFVGGGSGGDTYPVVATARAVERLAPGAACLFFATESGAEGGMLEAEGIAPVKVPASRFTRANLLRFPFALCAGYRKARAALAGFGPSLLVSGGGFVSPPVVLAARRLGIPVVLLEPNSVAGRANRVLARLATRVFTAYESAAGTLPDPGIVERLGMPLRYTLDEARRANRRRARTARLVVGVMGGSLGAERINRAAWDSYAALGTLEGLQLLHVTGRRDHPAALAAFEAAGCPAGVEVRPYQQAMAELYEEVDVLVTRGGAMTCAELVEFRCPALIVPRPHYGDHQTKNARPLEAAGGAELMPQDQFSAEALQARVLAWLQDPAAFEAQRSAYEALRRPGADERVARRVLALAGHRLEVAA